MVKKLFSHKNVFYDGEKNLHPSFKIRNLLLVVTHTRPKETPFVLIAKNQIKSTHFVPKTAVLYLTAAYNQLSERYNNIPGGFIELTQKQVDFIEATFVS